MKKFFLMVAALAAFTFTSCNSDDDILGVVNNGEIEEVTLTVEVDNGVKTKAEEHAANTVTWNNTTYFPRYVLEVWTGTDRYDRKVKTSDAGNANKANEFTLNIPKGSDYKLVVWVDYVTGTSTADNFYNTNADTPAKGLKEVTQNTGALTWNPALDAFTDTINWKNGEFRKKSVIAKRPFARVNVQAKDAAAWKALLDDGTAADQALKLTVKVNQVYDVFNAYTQKVVTTTKKDITETHSTTTSLIDSESSKYEYVSTIADLTGQTNIAAKDSLYFSGFVFADEAVITTVDLSIEMKAKKSNTYSPSYNITNVPLQRNYATSIIGNLVVGEDKFTVYVDELYERESSGDNMTF